MRTITIVFGVTAIAFFTLTIGPIITELPYVTPVWDLVAAILVFGMPPALAIACRLLDLATLKRALGAYAVIFAIVVITWLPAMLNHAMPIELSPWPFGLTALGTVPAALAWRPAIAWGYLVANAAVVAPIRFFAAGGGDLAVGVQDALFTLTFASIFTALAMVAMRNGYALDRLATISMASAARVAASEAKTREQGRLDALVHDEVMAALYYASQDQPELDESVRRQAARALNQLARVHSEVDGEQAVPVDDFVTRMRSIAATQTAPVSFEVAGERSQPIPGAVAAAFAEATTEALRNSVAYAAGSGAKKVHDSVSRLARIELSTNGVTVTVEDDGVGFDERTVEPHRLGILVSIRGRLAVEAGGSATVESKPDHGVLVRMDWRS